MGNCICPNCGAQAEEILNIEASQAVMTNAVIVFFTKEANCHECCEINPVLTATRVLYYDENDLDWRKV